LVRSDAERGWSYSVRKGSRGVITYAIILVARE